MFIWNFFNTNLPIFQLKPSAFSVPNLPGLWRIHWQLGDRILLSTFFTQHDQACLLWSAIAAIVFITAQFFPIDWTLQAYIASGFTLVGMIAMIGLTWCFTSLEKIRWILHSWSALMLFGVLITDWGVLLGQGEVLVRICPLWLGLSGIGYGVTGVGMRSRAILLIGLAHLAAIAGLSYVEIWQPLMTGFVISVSSFLLATLQWDSNGVCGYQREYGYGIYDRVGSGAEPLHRQSGHSNLDHAPQQFPGTTAEPV